MYVLKLRIGSKCWILTHQGVVVLIDLVLQTRQAYRHVLYNADYAKLILKMALLAIICDGYIDWASLPNAGEFFEQEYLFYAMCGKVTAGKLTQNHNLVAHLRN